MLSAYFSVKFHPYGFVMGLIFFLGEERVYQRKGERVGKELGGAGVLARKTVKEVRMDFDLAGSKKSFKED